ncbi:MAG: hypothetical protein O3B27_05785 [Actinomycetota bacterium]|jgi:hypothetical protein|nr:hypothetical protein [Actinomycetes bacterium]MDA2991053.1 hypothetical protein [Actinomycetota bacterium]
MTDEFAYSLTDLRLLQTARLLEWMIGNCPPDVEALNRALGAVNDARNAILHLRAGSPQGPG